jgi:hypothetical protein
MRSSRGRWWLAWAVVVIVPASSLLPWRAAASGIAQSAYNLFQDEGSNVTRRTTANFVGSGVTVTDVAGVTNISIPGAPASMGYDQVQDESVNLTQRSVLNCVGAGIICADVGGKTELNVPGATGMTVDGFFLKNGSTFYIGPNYQVATLPMAGTYTWVNQGGATETAVGNALVLAAPASTDNIRARTVAIGMAETTLTVLVACTSQFTNSHVCGVGFRESGTQKLVEFGNALTSAGAFVQINCYTDPTTYFSTPFASPANFGQFTGTIWFQIVKSGGNLSYRTSNDGVNFVELFTHPQNTCFTAAPDQWFYEAHLSDNTGQGMFTTLYSWKTL